jgi:hypothetical protein
MINSTQLYQTVVAKGIRHDSHASDLYLPVNKETTAIIADYEYKANVTTFLSNIPDEVGIRRMWYDIPFAYLPYWEKREQKV